MIFIHRSTIFILFTVLHGIASGNSAIAGGGKFSEEDNLINCFFGKLYNFSFDEADSLVTVMADSDFDNATINNLKANLAWWRLLSGDAINSNINKCDFHLEEALREKPGKQPDLKSLFNIIYAYSLKARLENYKGNAFKSLIFFHKSISYIEKCTDLQEEDEKLNLVLGLYYYFIDYFKVEYFMAGTLLFPFQPGDKVKGLRYLEDCLDSEDEMVRTEACYFLLKIYTSTDKNDLKALKNAHILTSNHPANLVYSMEQMKLMIILNKPAEVQTFRDNLLKEIIVADNINNVQKNHFINQIEHLSNRPSDINIKR